MHDNITVRGYCSISSCRNTFERQSLEVASDRDVWTTAEGLIKQHGDQAYTRAVAHHQAMLERGDREGMAVWKQIRRAVRGLQADEPYNDSRVH